MNNQEDNCRKQQEHEGCSPRSPSMMKSVTLSEGDQSDDLADEGGEAGHQEESLRGIEISFPQTAKETTVSFTEDTSVTDSIARQR